MNFSGSSSDRVRTRSQGSYARLVLSITPRPWNVFAHQCRAVGRFGDNNTGRSRKNGFSSISISPFIQLLRASHSILRANVFASGRDTKRATLLSPASFLHKVGKGTKGKAQLCFQRLFLPAVVESQSCTQEWELVKAKSIGSEKSDCLVCHL